MDVDEPLNIPAYLCNNDYEIAALVNQVDIDIQYDIQEVQDLKDKYDLAILEITAKKSEIKNLKAKLKSKGEDFENPRSLAGKLYYDKEFADVKIVCIGKTFDCHKAVLSCQSEVFKTMTKNKALIEKQEAVMEIHENDIKSDTMEQLLFYVYHEKVRDVQMINTELLRGADKYNVIGLFGMCVKYLQSNLSFLRNIDIQYDIQKVQDLTDKYDSAVLEIKAKESEIENLKAELKTKEEDCENLHSLAGKLYYEKEFTDVKIVCVDKTFDCHKAVLSCQNEVLKTMIKNKGSTEKQAALMEIYENDVNSITMEQLLFYVYHEKVKDIQMINTDLLRAADKYNVLSLFDMCVEYLQSNLSLENALDVLVSAELINQKNLFDSASRFVRRNTGRLNKTGAYKEMFEKDPKFIAIVMSKFLDVEQERFEISF